MWHLGQNLLHIQNLAWHPTLYHQKPLKKGTKLLFPSWHGTLSQIWPWALLMYNVWRMAACASCQPSQTYKYSRRCTLWLPVDISFIERDLQFMMDWIGHVLHLIFHWGPYMIREPSWTLWPLREDRSIMMDQIWHLYDEPNMIHLTHLLILIVHCQYSYHPFSQLYKGHTGMWLRSQLAKFSQFWSKFCHLWDQCKSSEKMLPCMGVGSLLFRNSHANATIAGGYCAF